MFTQMQTGPTNKICLNILNEAGLFVLNMYKWSFKHATSRTSVKSLQKATRKKLPRDISSSATNEHRKGDKKHVFSFSFSVFVCVFQDLLWFAVQ